MKSGPKYEQFKQVLEWFLESKYGPYVRVTTTDSPIHDFVQINTESLTLGFCNRHDAEDIDASYIYINGRVCFDHKKNFDKFSNCSTPIYFLPETKEDFDKLLDILAYVECDSYLTDLAIMDHNENDDIAKDIFTPLDHLWDDHL